MKRAALALVRNFKGEVLAVSRKDNPFDLGLAGGKVEPGESVFEAACRELREETDVIALLGKKIFEATDSEGYLATTFNIMCWINDPVALEAGQVLWVPWSRLFEENCSFRDYNKSLYEKLMLDPYEQQRLLHNPG